MDDTALKQQLEAGAMKSETKLISIGKPFEAARHSIAELEEQLAGKDGALTEAQRFQLPFDPLQKF